MSAQHRVVFTFLMIFLLSVVFAPRVATAADFTVTTTDDILNSEDGECSLREAIIVTNSNNPTIYDTDCGGSGGLTDNIILPAGDYTLTIATGEEDFAASGDLDINDSLEILGANVDTTTITTTYDEDGVFAIDPTNISDITLTIENVTITGTVDSSAAPITVGTEQTNSDLTLTNVKMINNQNIGGNGGAIAIYSTGIVDLDQVQLIGNEADESGGAIYNPAVFSTLTISDSLIKDNISSEEAGGLYSDQNTGLNIYRSAFIGNESYDGAGIFLWGYANIENSTISGNISSGEGSEGGGILVTGSGELQLYYSTVTQNSSDTTGGGITNDGDLVIYGSLVSDNTSTSGAEIYVDTLGEATVSEKGSNIIGHSGLTTAEAIDGYTPDGSDLVLTSDGGSSTVNSDILDLTASDNGGATPTHALPSNSPALDFISVEVDGCGISFDEDQRGEDRPDDDTLLCDAGAYEFQPEAVQEGPDFYVNTTDDLDDQVCSTLHCSLREAIAAANASSNQGTDRIYFDIAGGAPYTISLSTPLPVIDDYVDILDPAESVIIDGGESILSGLTFAPGSSGSDVEGISLTGFTEQAIFIDNSYYQTIDNVKIYDNPGSGIVINGDDNYIVYNEIRDNGLTGITVSGGDGNVFSQNSIYGNGGLGIDLGGDGVDENDFTDVDDGPNGKQNYPILQKATLIDNDNTLQIQGYIFSKPNFEVEIEFYANQSCDDSFYGEGQQFIGFYYDFLDSNGGKSFIAEYDLSQLETSFAIENGVAITALAQTFEGGEGEPSEGSSEFSRCITINPNNDTWVNAYPIQLEPTGFSGVQQVRIPLAPEAELATTDTVFSGSVEQYLTSPGQSRWFRFPVSPGSTIVGELSNLPANYDLLLFRDIQQTYDSLGDPDTVEDLALLSAEFAPEMFTPEMFTPEMFTPEMFTPEMFTPEMFTPEMFTPEMFTPEMFTPEMFTPEMFTPEMFTPEMFTPEMFTPEMFTPEMFTPEMFTPEMFTPEMFTQDQRYYASALAQSALAISAFDGTADERVEANSWNESGDFYLQVTGRNGVYDPNNPFLLEATVFGGVCDGITSSFQPTITPPVGAGTVNTLILYDSSRMNSSDPDFSAMQAALNSLAAHPSVNGLVIDLANDAGVAAANTQADQNRPCVYAKNVVAQTIKKIIEQHEEEYPTIQYITLIGNDDDIPFFRYPDRGLLANEDNYVPPVDPLSASEASLRLGYILGQDEYGADVIVRRKNATIPLPKNPVGRLVETPAEITTVIQAYLDDNGQVPSPSSGFVAGYDFLVDASEAVSDELQLGLGTGGTVNDLITPADLAPADPASWTADDLRQQWLQNPQRYDVVFLTGHFSSFSALAADYQTRIFAEEASLSQLDMTNTIIFSNGCHSGYNLVNEHAVPGVSIEPDWAQAFARKGAWLLAGTGYQYGDTDFVEYSERLYVEFSKELRTGTGAVATGDAVVAAKQRYLTETANMRPIHEKVLLEAAIFGLPMLSIDMPGQRINPTANASIVANGDVNAFTTDPGDTLGLYYADKNISTPTTEFTKTLESVINADPVITTYFEGQNGKVINPGEPILPLARFNVEAPSNIADTLLRGISFLGGDYTEYTNRIPLTGAATTEIRGIHTPFYAPVHFPVIPWEINYLDYLIRGMDEGETNLHLMPMQFLSDDSQTVTGTMRVFDNMSFRFYYSGNTSSYENVSEGITNIPALASPPIISLVYAEEVGTDVIFEATVTGDPSAGIQEVRVTYTALSGPFYGSWQSLELEQDENDSRIWRGTLPLNGTDAGDVRYMVQAVNGVGLTSIATNKGAYYIPNIDPGNPAEDPDGEEPVETNVSLTDISQAAVQAESGKYGTFVTFTAELKSNGQPLADQILEFGLTSQRVRVKTDSQGVATTTITIIGLPQEDILRVTFNGAPGYLPSSVSTPFTILPIGTILELITTTPTFAADGRADLSLSLTDETGRPLREKSVIITIESTGEFYSESVITDLFGNAVLRTVPLPPGEYTVNAYYGQEVQLPGGTVDLSNPRYLPSEAIGLTLISNTPPTVDANGPYNVGEGGTTLLDATGSDINTGQELEYAWDLDNNSNYTEIGQQVTFSAAGLSGPSGPLPVGVQVCDPLDCATDTAQVTVLNVAPTIHAVNNDGPIDSGQQATITVDASDPADDLSYSFDCDDNNDYEIGPGSANSAACTFNSPGNYTVNVLVDDGDAQVTGSTQVTVNGDPDQAFNYYCVYAEGALKLYQQVEINNCSIASEDKLTIGLQSQVDGDGHSRGGDISVSIKAEVEGTVAAFEDVMVWNQGVIKGNVHAGDFATIWFNSIVEGDVLGVSGVYVAPSATVKGTVDDNASPPSFPAISPITLNLSAGDDDVTVPRRESMTLQPGDYDALRVRRGAELTLVPGHYSFTHIDLDPQSTIIADLNAGSGAIHVDVTGEVTGGFEVEVRVEGGSPALFEMQVAGDRVTFDNSSDVTAFIIAPEAKIILNKKVTFNGALYGQEINLLKDVVINGTTAVQQ